MNSKSLDNIESLKELRQKKKKLRKKLKKREDKLYGKVSFINELNKEENIASGILEGLGIQNSVLSTIIPFIVKHKKEIINSPVWKNFYHFLRRNPYILFAVGGGIAGFLGYRYVKSLLFKEQEITEAHQDLNENQENEIKNPQTSTNNPYVNDVIF